MLRVRGLGHKGINSRLYIYIYIYIYLLAYRISEQKIPEQLSGLACYAWLSGFSLWLKQSETRSAVPQYLAVIQIPAPKQKCRVLRD